jgi:hypothetical protein
MIKIYKISGGGLNYVGSTNNKYINSRLSQHKNSYKKYLNGKYGFNSVFNILDKTDNVSIEVLEECNVDIRYDREQHYISNIECVNILKLNHRQDYYKSKEYYTDNKEIINQKTKEYYNNNKDKQDIQNANRKRIVKCECGIEIQHQELPRHRRSKKHLDFINQTSS